MMLYWIGGMTAGPPWQDMMSHIVPEEEHNRYFSGRSALLSIGNLCTNMMVAFLLQERLNRETVLQFVFIGFVFRVLSLGAVWLHPTPAGRVKTAKQKSALLDREVASRNTEFWGLVGLALFLFWLRFGVNISGPFFNQYMLKYAHFGLTEIFIISSIPLVPRIFLMSNWGSILDRNWVWEGVAICGIAITLLPCLYTVSTQFSWISLLQAYSGHVWAGFEVLSVLLVQRLFPGNVVKTLAVTFAAGTLGGALGGITGGYLLDAGFAIPRLFQFSTIIRLVAVSGLMFYLRTHCSLRFRSLRIPESMLLLFSLEPSKKAARSIRSTMSSVVTLKVRS